MKIAAIIAEYNPFHNGHRYLAQAVRKHTDADFVIALMSGCFVQRGAPAVLDKYIRADFALHDGIDLVLELPTVYALGHAEQFASGAVRILDALGCDYLCFGCEDENTDRLKAAAALFEYEPEEFETLLMDALKSGLSYPAAREKAACICLPKQYPDAFSSEEEVSALLQGPNNILAISYLQVMLRIRSAMEIVPVLRAGSTHHDSLLPERKSRRERDITSTPEPILLAEDVQPGTIRSSGGGQTVGRVGPRMYPSSRAIREVLSDSIATHRFLSGYPDLKRSVSTYVYDALQDARTRTIFQFEDDYSVMLRYRLLMMGKDEILTYCIQNESFANRLLHHRSGWQSISELTANMKHKSRTYSGISRTLFRILLGIDDTAEAVAASEIAYARVLGMREEAAPILHEWKEADAIPLLLNLSEDTTILSDAQKDMLRTDILAADLYAAVHEIKTGEVQENEYTRRFLKL